MKLVQFNSYQIASITQSRNYKEHYFFYEEGNVFTSLATLFVFSFILIGILLLNFTISTNDTNINSVNSNNFNYMIEDYNRNIPIITREIIGNLSNEVIKNHTSCYNSRNVIKEQLQESLDHDNKKYKENNDIKFESQVLSVNNGEDPYHINVKTLVKGIKGKMEYNHVVESVVSIEGLKDPLPFIMCKDHPTLVENGTKIYYNDALSYYLAANDLLNPDVYENATGSLIIRKCPYDPYEHHGEDQCMKNCVDNGYFHESADGSCYLCRLEGKGGCLHYGLETFISPHIVANLSYESISCSDHVIYQDHYSGESIGIYFENGFYEILILDDSHQAKYGLN